MAFKVTLKTDRLVYDIKSKARTEAAVVGFADDRMRYILEAGSEKNDEIRLAIMEGNASLTNLCSRFLITDNDVEYENQLYPEDAFEYNLTVTDRRLNGKGEALTRLMHAYIVDYALARFYSSMAREDLCKKHSNLCESLGREIHRMLFIKRPPLSP